MGYINKEQQRSYNQKYFRSIHGVAKRLYHHMKERSKKNGWKFDFSYNEFSEWLHKTDFEKFYDMWVMKNYDKRYRPSIDRIDDMGIYEFSNMRVIRWFDNWKRGQESEKNKKAYIKSFSEYRKMKSYSVIVRKNNFFMLFKDVNEILETFPFMLRCRICDCCNNHRPRHHGFTFQKIIKGVVAQ